jgi:hypothetical protein
LDRQVNFEATLEESESSFKTELDVSDISVSPTRKTSTHIEQQKTFTRNAKSNYKEFVKMTDVQATVEHLMSPVLGQVAFTNRMNGNFTEALKLQQEEMESIRE